MSSVLLLLLLLLPLLTVHAQLSFNDLLNGLDGAGDDIKKGFDSLKAPGLCV